MNSSINISKALLNLLSNALFDANVDVGFTEIDIEALFNEATAQGVSTTVFDKLPEDVKEKAPDTYGKWEKYALTSIQFNIRELVANSEIEKLFKAAGIPVCTIKGFACAAYYPEPSLRQMGDIDFIVPKDRIEDGRKLLTEAGFYCTDKEEVHDFHIAFKKNGFVYEMHEGITSFLDDEGNIEKYLGKITEETRVADLAFSSLTVPNSFIHGLVMLLHMQRHMLSGGGVGLRHLCDWAVFVNSFENDEWESMFEEKLKKIRLWEFAKALSKVSEKYLHMPDKKWFADFDENVADKLLEDLIVAGNFGYKDAKRYQELAFVSRDVNHRGKILGFCNAYINKVYSWNPKFKKHRVLLPFGILAYPIRTLFLILFKKKKINFAENYANGQKRNDLYNELFK